MLLYRSNMYIFSHVMESTLHFSAISVFVVNIAFRSLIERVTVRVFGIQVVLLQFKVTRRHLLLHFSQFSFVFAVNLNTKLNQFNYRNLEMFRNECTYSRFFVRISRCRYFVFIFGLCFDIAHVFIVQLSLNEMPIPDSCLRLMILSMKMICSRFTAE